MAYGVWLDGWNREASHVRREAKLVIREA